MFHYHDTYYLKYYLSFLARAFLIIIVIIKLYYHCSKTTNNESLLMGTESSVTVNFIPKFTLTKQKIPKSWFEKGKVISHKMKIRQNWTKLKRYHYGYVLKEN